MGVTGEELFGLKERSSILEGFERLACAAIKGNDNKGHQKKTVQTTKVEFERHKCRRYARTEECDAFISYKVGNSMLLCEQTVRLLWGKHPIEGRG